MTPKERKRVYDRQRKERFKQVIRDIKEATPCADCKANYPFYIMQFDHVRGEKEGDISRLVANRQFKKALAEITKCDVVCANCHSARSYERQPRGKDHPQFAY